jgi:hypothetical protein
VHSFAPPAVHASLLRVACVCHGTGVHVVHVAAARVAIPTGTDPISGAQVLQYSLCYSAAVSVSLPSGLPVARHATLPTIDRASQSQFDPTPASNNAVTAPSWQAPLLLCARQCLPILCLLCYHPPTTFTLCREGPGTRGWEPQVRRVRSSCGQGACLEKEGAPWCGGCGPGPTVL